MSPNGALLFVGVSISVAVAAHWFVRTYWLATLAGMVSASVVNIFDEIVKQGFKIGPSDAVFWLPMLFFEGMVAAMPVIAIVGIPFYVIRRKRKTTGMR